MAKLDVCSTDYPDKMLLDEKYEEKVWGGDLYRGGRITGTGWVEGSERSGI